MTIYLTTGAVARLAKVSPDGVRYWVRTGRLRPAARAENGQLLFERVAVEQFAAAREASRTRG
jgi:DNA-binding transcriptional MerR regulator